MAPAAAPAAAPTAAPAASQAATAPSAVVLHYALMSFCKLWLLLPRRSAEMLALLEGAWDMLTNPSSPATPLHIQVDATAEARGTSQRN